MSDTSRSRDLAQQLLDGSIEEPQFLREIAKTTMASLDHANVDLDRQRRAGYPEVVFGEGKSVDAVVDIVNQLVAAGQAVLVTRVTELQAAAVRQQHRHLIYNPVARTLSSRDESSARRGHVAVVSAGTSDLPVAEEVIETVRWMQVEVESVCDVGVAGPHRLPAHLDRLQTANAIVVVAGMEGALPSVVAGYVAVPIIAVPTSVGYGANLGGIAALLSMLNSCAANVAVVNIDAGFKAGYLAGMIARAADATPRVS